MKAAVLLVLALAASARADAPASGAPKGAGGAPKGAEITVRVPDKLEVAVGSTTQLKIDIAVDRGFTVSKDGPVWIDVAPDTGLYVKKRRIARVDAVDPEADVPRFVIPVRGDVAGDHAVKLRIRLWLCGGKVCRPIDLKRQSTITVSPPRPETSQG